MKNIKAFNKKWFNSENGIYYDSSVVRNYKDDNGHLVDIAIVLSGRGRRKSFNVSASLIRECYENKKKFGYVRRYEKELNTNAINEYFADKEICIDDEGRDVGHFVEELTDGLCDCVRYKEGHFYLAKKIIEEASTKITYEYIQDIGSVFAMNLEPQYKSRQYPDYIALIFEEFLISGRYINNEANHVLSLCSTVFRGRHGICYMIANTISRINPYVADWSLTKMRTMKAGEQHFYKLYNGSKKGDSEDYYLISVEYLRNKDDEIVESKKDKGIRTKQKFITRTNNFEELNRYKAIPKKIIEEYIEKEPTTVVFEYKSFKFKGMFINLPKNIIEFYCEEQPELLNDTMLYLYIERKTTPRKHNTRLYTDNPDNIFDEMTTQGFKPFCQFDRNVGMFLQNGWCIFADNLTGNEFFQCFNALRTI